jgi:Flp pilus assembly protein CpaB
VDPSYRSVSETILRNLRVIALDQTIKPSPPKTSDVRLVGQAELHLPKTVTLEVTIRDAEMLMVAVQLGKVQLMLRSLEEATIPGAPTPEDPPTWASEVSPALNAFARPRRLTPVEPKAPGEPARRSTISVEVSRGSATTMRCFTNRGETIDCGSAPERAAGGAPAAPPNSDTAPSAGSRGAAPEPAQGIAPPAKSAPAS